MLSLAYNAVVTTAQAALGLYARTPGREPRPKLRRFAEGRRGLLDRIEYEMEQTAKNDPRPVVWVHAASLGEFAIARPIIKAISERGRYRVVVTFFSPSGYENVTPEDTPGVDHIFYLPMDTRRNARRFLEAVRPARAVFMVSEYWYNYLAELRRRSVPTFLVSANITPESVFLKPYGVLHRRMLGAYSGIFVLNDTSRLLLGRLGCDDKTMLTGDPLFDNALARSREPWSDPRIERFVGGSKRVLAVGSLHDDNDLAMTVRTIADAAADDRFIIVPHEPTESEIAHIEQALPCPSVRLSQADSHRAEGARVLIVDSMGSLAYIYRYSTAAYVGGGFTPYLHSVIEPAVYGIPVSFGPRIERKAAIPRLVECGVGTMVSTPEGLSAWWRKTPSGNPGPAPRPMPPFMDGWGNATEQIVDEILK